MYIRISVRNLWRSLLWSFARIHYISGQDSGNSEMWRSPTGRHHYYGMLVKALSQGRTSFHINEKCLIAFYNRYYNFVHNQQRAINHVSFQNIWAERKACGKRILLKCPLKLASVNLWTWLTEASYTVNLLVAYTFSTCYSYKLICGDNAFV
jgi:hypothetical protein